MKSATASTQVRFFEAKKLNEWNNLLSPVEKRTVQKLGLKDKPDARIGFKVEGTIIYAKERTKAGRAKRRWDAWIGRSKNRKASAEAALKRLEIRVNELPADAINTEVIVKMNKVRTQLWKWDTVAAGDLQALFDTISDVEKAHDAKLKQAEREQEQAAINKAVKIAGQLVKTEAEDFIAQLPSKAGPETYRAEAARGFQDFIEQVTGGNAAPPDYKFARTFAAQWAHLEPNDVPGNPAEINLFDGFVKLVMRACGMDAPPAVPQPLQKFKADGEKLSPDGHPKSIFAPHKDLGKGGYGTVSIYKREQSTETVVVKELLDGGSAQAEAQAHAQAQKGGADHIVRLLGMTNDGRKLLLQHAPNGDAMKVVQRILDGKLADPGKSRAFMTMFADMVQGVEKAHANGVMHLDLKPENFFVDGNGELLLGDFGTSPKTLVEFMKSPVDSPDFSAPELVNNIKTKGLITHKADIWSLGVILYQLNSPRLGAADNPDNSPKLLRPFPYGSFTSEASELINKFAGKEDRLARFKQLGLRPNNILHQLIIQMLDPDPLQRPSAHHVLKHPLIARYVENQTIVASARQTIIGSIGAERPQAQIEEASEAPIYLNEQTVFGPPAAHAPPPH